MDSCVNHAVEQRSQVYDDETTNNFATITIKRYADMYGGSDAITMCEHSNAL